MPPYPGGPPGHPAALPPLAPRGLPLGAIAPGHRRPTRPSGGPPAYVPPAPPTPCVAGGADATLPLLMSLRPFCMNPRLCFILLVRARRARTRRTKHLPSHPSAVLYVPSPPVIAPRGGGLSWPGTRAPRGICPAGRSWCFSSRRSTATPWPGRRSTGNEARPAAPLCRDIAACMRPLVESWSKSWWRDRMSKPQQFAW